METSALKQANVTVNGASDGVPFDVPMALHTLCQQMTSLHAKVDILTTNFNNLESQFNKVLTTGNNIQKTCMNNTTTLVEQPENGGWDSGFHQSSDTNFLNVPQTRRNRGSFEGSDISEASRGSVGSDYLQVTLGSTVTETRRSPSHTTHLDATLEESREDKSDGYIQVGIRENSREESKLSNVIGIGNGRHETNHPHADVRSNSTNKDDRVKNNRLRALDSTQVTDTINTISNLFKPLPSLSQGKDPGKDHHEKSPEKAKAFLLDKDNPNVPVEHPQQTDFVLERKTQLSQEPLTRNCSQQASHLLPVSSSGAGVDCNESALDQYGLLRDHVRKRSYTANFGDALPKSHPPSPVPFAKFKARIPYSDFKRHKTDFFEDNRPKYFDKMLDVISVGEVEDTEPKKYAGSHSPDVSISVTEQMAPGTAGDSGGNSADVSGTEQLKAETTEFQPEEAVVSIMARTDLPILPKDSAHPKNNEQIPDSGFRNEHGPDDNRFVEEVLIVSARRSDGDIFSNIPIILTGSPKHRFSGQDVLGSSNLDKDERNRGAGRNPLNTTNKVVPETELAAIVEREKEKAQQCTDPKSTHGIDTVLCLDISASMNGQPLREARNFITRFLEGLDESATGYSLEENVALVTYGNENQVLQHLTKDYSLVQNKLKKLKADGPSPLWLGLGLCLTELSTRGGICTMDCQTLLPRVIIISDFFASVKNVLQGPDITQFDRKGNSEVTGLIGKNRKTCTFSFVVVGQNTNRTLLQQMETDELFTTEDVFYLSQYFRAQDLVNIALTERVGLEVDEQFIHYAVKQRGMTERWEREITEIMKQKTEEVSGIVYTTMVPNTTESNTAVIEEAEELEFGTRIKANPNWTEYHNRQGLSGFVIAPRKNGLLKVLWEDGSQGKVKYGVDGIYDVVLDDREPTDEKLRIGTVVERGQDWRWGDQDGGVGNIGVVCSYDENRKVVEVLWQQGGKGNYRYGYRGKFDVLIRYHRERVSMSEQ